MGARLPPGSPVDSHPVQTGAVGASSWVERRAAPVALAVFVLAFYFWNLGGGSLKFWDEVLTAERSREMLLTGHWLTAHDGFVPNFNKPPLYYALTASTFRLLGENEFSVRLWSVLFGIGCIVFTGLIAGRIHGDRRAALLAAFLLASNAHWINKTREGMLDSGLMLSMLAGMYWLVYAPAARGSALGSGLSFAAGCLVKNPLCLLGLAAPWIEPRGKPGARRGRRLAVAAAVAAVFGLGWYVAQYLVNTSDFGREFGRDNIAVNLDPAAGNLPGPWYYYIEAWWGHATLHLFLLAIPILLCAWRCRPALNRVRTPLFLAAVLLAIMSFSASKRGNYLVLIHPFTAIASGCLWMSWLDTLKKPRVRAAILWALVGAAAVAMPARFKPQLDGSPPLKEAALWIRANARPGDLAILFDRAAPFDAVMFYSHVQTFDPGEDSFERSVARYAGWKPGTIFVVVPADGEEAALESLRPARDVRAAYRNDGYAILAVRPGPSP